ncbi:hypothetical protein R50072_07410 [Simiduia litorea]|uniref:universal stress protein n=1 Tax=Simiduia litorea TaxID=1435348 RepID=UPI0036F1A62C
MYSNILFISTNSPTEENAITSALSIAKKLGATLEIFVAEPEIPTALENYKKAFKDTLRSDVQSRLASALDRASLTPASVSVKISFTAVAKLTDAIATKVNREGFSLVIKEKSIKSGLFDFLSTDMALAKHCPCSMLFLRPDQVITQSPKRFGVALSRDPQEALESSMAAALTKVGAALSDQFNSRLTLITCYTDAIINMLNTFSHGEIAEKDRADWERGIAHENDTTLRKLAAIAGIETPDTIQILGNPEDALTDYASSKKLDLLIVGATNKSHLTNFLLGSTTEELLRNLPCALLLVKLTNKKA